MKITKENLVDNGYRKFQPSYIDKWTDGYQKDIYDKSTRIKLYSINIHRYDYSQYKHVSIDESWNSSTQFNMNEDETIQVDFFINETTELERVESFYHDVFYKFNCTPYD